MTNAPALRAGADTLAAPLPPLLTEAEHLAGTVTLGEHGRRRAGLGDTFWQYRPAQPMDPARSIDWRRSARSDATFVQDKEWQVAQSVMLWADNSAAMQFKSDNNLPSKGHRAAVLTLATGILLSRGGERVGLAGQDMTPRRGTAQIARIAGRLAETDNADYGSPSDLNLPAHGRAVLVSDFMGDLSLVEATLSQAAGRDVRGVILQVLDPQEEAFPFDGRTTFESMTGGIRHETLKASGLRQRYQDRLAERKDRLTSLARATSWQFHTHHTDQSAASALLWIYQALERRV